MSIRKIFQLGDSLSVRLSLWVTSAVAVILLISVAATNYFVTESILSEERLKANGTLSAAEQRINAMLSNVETAVQNHLDQIMENLDQPHEKLYDITRRIVRNNPSIVGSAIAFEPNYYPDQGLWFSPYSYSDGDSILSKQLGTPEYEYHDMEWYAKPKELKHDYWSDPYHDTGGGEKTMTTYSYPLQDEAGNVFAVVTADVSLDWLGNLMDVRYYQNAYSFILGRSGTFITHPVPSVILNKTIFSYAEEVGYDDMIAVGHEMLGGQRNMKSVTSPTYGKSFIFYGPFPHTGWSMALVCQSNEFFKEAHRTGLIVAALIILMLVLLIVIIQQAVHRLTRPLATFTKAVDEVAQGNLQAPLPDIHTKDEMQRLHHSFSIMQESLALQMEELKQANESKGRIEGELKVARDIQMSMLPKVYPPYPERKDIEIYGQLVPAKAVGGDLYDFFIRDEKLFFCIGDVSGKGVPAALVMAMVRSLFRTVARHESNPVKIIKSINNSMCEGNESNMFVTLFIGALDLPTGKLRYCNAGHDKPLLLGSDITELPADPDLPIGVFAESDYVARESSIQAGTLMFLYTDGLTEAKNSKREQFGEQRMWSELQKGGESKFVIENMTEAVRQFVGEAPQSDDLTMLTIHYLSDTTDDVFDIHLSIKNNTHEINRLGDFVKEVSNKINLDPDTTMNVRLAVEEAVVNVINYAYPPGEEGEISVEAKSDGQYLSFTIIDAGFPFDPTASADVDTTLSAEDRPIGGLGIFLVRELMDTIHYERTDGKNVLTIKKKIDKK